MTNKIYKLLTLLIVLSVALPLSIIVPTSNVSGAPPTPVTFTILHHNDFHGQLEAIRQQPRPGAPGKHGQHRAHRSRCWECAPGGCRR